MQKKTLILMAIMLAAGILIGNLIAGPLFTLLIPSFGTVTLPIDVSCNPSSINWGNVTVGDSVTRNTTITNNGRDIASLNMTSGNQTVNILNYTLTWDAEFESLPNGYYIIANFTLTIYEANITASEAFTLDIWINDKG